MIKLISFIILIISPSYAMVDFYSAVRNFSLEFIYFTQNNTKDSVVLAPFGLFNLLDLVASSSENKIYSTELSNLTAILKEKSDGTTLVSDIFALMDTSLNVSPIFVDRLRYFKANIFRLEFKESTAARLSNILTKTNQYTPPIFGTSDFIDSVMIMGNIFFFKGTWSIPFNKSNTFLTTAYDQNGSVIGNFNMMSQEMKIPQSDIKDIEATVSELSFGKDGKYCMLIINPYEGVTINKVYRNLPQVTFKNIFDKLQSDVQEVGSNNVTLHLPKLEIESFLVLNRPMKDMGIYDAFSPESANFTNLSSDDLYIGDIEQRTKISMTEEGIEAFSTTPANLEVATRQPSITGRPFLFFVVDKATMTIIVGGINGRH